MPIIHICGASGSGKTTLGHKLCEYYKRKAIVIDLDIMLFEYVKKLEESKLSVEVIEDTWIKLYQSHLDEEINKIKNKLTIFVGLNTSIGSINFRGKKFDPPKHFYDLHADKTYYIDLPEEQILRQKFFRSVTKLAERKERYFTADQKDLFYMVDIQRWKKEIHAWAKVYKRMNYTFLTPDEIFNQILAAHPK
jgi:adenylate kinase family enzyme